MRLTLAAVALVVASPAGAEVPRCMAMAHVRTAALNTTYTMRDGESFSVQHIEQMKTGPALCGENRSCWPAADFDLVTPCTVGSMQGRFVELK